MQKPFLTGLKLKNSLSNQLVWHLSFRNNFNLVMAEASAGTRVDQPSTPTVTSDTPETTSAMTWFEESWGTTSATTFK